MRGVAAALTSFVGRAAEVAEVAHLLHGFRLVTVTGPGGVGKTRLAVEVARQAADRFADGVRLVELAAVADPAMVAEAVAGALGLSLAPGVQLASVLARRQLLLLLDNCEHVAAAAADFCEALLSEADDVRVIATSREPLGVHGEARYRLGGLALPVPGDPAGTGGAEAVTLFADRARQADPRFVMGPESAPVVARIVARLDGMPLAVELAAARVEALGLAQLDGRLDDRFRWLVGTDRRAEPRQRSLAATVDWSYQLLSEPERQVFRALSVFPGPFTLEAAEAVAGKDTGLAVLRLVDCSLLAPPRPRPDGRGRYVMLESLRAFGMERLAEAGEQDLAAGALARYALGVAQQAAAGLESGAGELAAVRWLEAEDATVHQSLGWALEHDHDMALRLGVALAHWWMVRGRWAAGYQLLDAAAGHAAEGSPQWCAAQFWLGLLTAGSAVSVSFGHLSAVTSALADGAPEPLLARALAWRAGCLLNLGRLPEAADEARRALALAEELGDPVGQAYALFWLAWAASYRGANDDCLGWMRRALRLDPTGVPGGIDRQCRMLLASALGEAGELAEARQHLAAALARSEQAGDLYDQGECLNRLAGLELDAGGIAEARAHARDAIALYSRTGAGVLLINSLALCGGLCAQTDRWRDAVTAWAALAAVLDAFGFQDPQGTSSWAQKRLQKSRKARAALGPAGVQAAEDRGAAMTPDTGAEYVLLLVTEEPGQPAMASGGPPLTARERELISLVARGRTDAQIAEQLFISVRTVGSHLDRIRDKTGFRRRADLTRLALQAGLI